MINATKVEDSNRRALESIAYRMLGTWADAEDIAQESLLKWHALDEDAQSAILSPLAWLTTVATRLCLDRLKSARRRREVYVGTWLPEPMLIDESSPADPMERAESVDMALMFALERLSPTERAAFLLHDVFEYKFSSIAEILGKSSAACRQLATRARTAIHAERARFDFDPLKHRALLEAFSKAATHGDATALEQILTEDIVLYSDGGGIAPAVRKVLRTREIVTRLFLGLGKKARDRQVNADIQLHTINGLPGLIQIREGALDTVLLISVSNNRIHTMYQQRNPAKLAKIATRLGLPCSKY